MKRLGENKGWANLKPAKKGEVRNPNGRPKGVVSIGQYYRNWLEADENLAAVTKQLLKKRPEVILHYAYGKPETTNVNLNTETYSIEEIATAIARHRIKERMAKPPEVTPGMKDDRH